MRYKVIRKQKNAANNWHCKYCELVFRTRRELAEHRKIEHPNKSGKSHVAWNKGLTCETDERIAKITNILREGYASGRLVNHQTGKPHTEEEKRKISETQKKNYAGKSRYIPVQEHRKSYAEQYFDVIFTDAQKQFPIDRYRLDYAWPDTKTYIEVDGEQHYTEEGLKHDNERMQVLESLGWICKKRIRWSEYQKLNEDEKKAFIESLL